MPRKASLFVEKLSRVPDPRRQGGNLRHKLVDILLLSLCGVIAGCEDFVEIAAFGREKEDFFRDFLELPHGIPTHDTLDRVMGMLAPDRLQLQLLEWLQAIRPATQEEGSEEPKVVAIDGKTLRRTFHGRSGLAALHVVSAWACESGLTLGQVAVDSKSNEITAIPKLLELLSLEATVVTIDAAGCQREIAEKIREKGGDYVLALKGNQPTLHDRVADYFEGQLEKDKPDAHVRCTKGEERGHGRHEKREIWVAPIPEDWQAAEQWRDVKSMVMVCTEQTPVHGGETQGDVRFYISSLAPKAQLHRRVIRSHWGIENGLHWVLDVIFKEDERRLWKGRGPENWAMLNRLAVSLLKAERSTKRSIKVKRKVAGWKNEYLLTVLGTPP